MTQKTIGLISTFKEKTSFLLIPVSRLLDKVRDFYRSVKRFSKNLWYYKGWLWDACDFDFHYLLELQALYLKNLVNHNRSCPMGSEESAKNIEKAIKLIQALLDDDFCRVERDAHDIKWGKLQRNSEPPDERGLSKCIFSRERAVTQEQKEQELQESRARFKLEIRRMKATEKKLFEYMHKNYRSWWC